MIQFGKAADDVEFMHMYHINTSIEYIKGNHTKYAANRPHLEPIHDLLFLALLSFGQSKDCEA